MEPENILSQHDQAAIEGDALQGYAREGAAAAERASSTPQMPPEVEAHLVGVLQRAIGRESERSGLSQAEITQRLVEAVRLAKINDTYKEQ